MPPGGIPGHAPWQFVAFFTSEIPGASPATVVTRIEFRYLRAVLDQEDWPAILAELEGAKAAARAAQSA